MEIIEEHNLLSELRDRFTSRRLSPLFHDFLGNYHLDQNGNRIRNGALNRDQINRFLAYANITSARR